MIALAVAVAVHLYMGLWELGVADQSPSFYVTNLAIFLAPAVAYAAAVVLALTSRGGRVIWGVLLACGIVLCAIDLFYLVTSGFGELMVAPPCLVALSLVQLLSRPRSGVPEAQ
jgi:hypothetical protein